MFRINSQDCLAQLSHGHKKTTSPAVKETSFVTIISIALAIEKEIKITIIITKTENFFSITISPYFG